MFIQDKRFGNTILFVRHNNPEATVESQIKPFKQFTLKRAYLGKTFFWGFTPLPGDHLIFKFAKPIFIKRYVTNVSID